MPVDGSKGDGRQFSKDYQPKNRRKSTKFLTEMMTKQLQKRNDITIEGVDVETGKKTKIRVSMPTTTVIVQALLRQAAKGNVTAIEAVFDRIEGKPTQAVDLTTNKIRVTRLKS